MFIDPCAYNIPSSIHIYNMRSIIINVTKLLLPYESYIAHSCCIPSSSIYYEIYRCYKETLLLLRLLSFRSCAHHARTHSVWLWAREFDLYCEELARYFVLRGPRALSSARPRDSSFSPIYMSPISKVHARRVIRKGCEQQKQQQLQLRHEK